VDSHGTIQKINMKKIIIAFALITVLTSCEDKHKYKKVVSISTAHKTYQVTTTTQSGGNTIQRGAGGAIIGGGVDYLLGGNGTGGAIVGGLIGAATTDGVTQETRTEMRTDVYYTVLFSDSSIDTYTNYCHLSKGDSVIIYTY